MTQEYIKIILNYNQETGIFTRKVDMANGRFKAGSIAGYTNSRGYVVLNILKKNRKAHRVAFLYMTGSMPEQVDHINRVKNDNRWNNLREADAYLNMKNQPTVKSNECKFRGVYKSRNKFRARIGDNGKIISLGTFNTFDEAREARVEAEIKLKYIV